MYFQNRVEAGKKLAGFFDHIDGQNAVVYALPRGGVVIGKEIAQNIHAPLDLIITRKIRHPLQPEYAIGAIAENGHVVFDKEAASGIDKDYIRQEVVKQTQESKRRRGVYLQGKKPLLSKDKTAILADDGIATGLTMKAAMHEIKTHHQPKKIIVAIPVIPADIAKELENLGAEVLAIITDKKFLGSIGAYYKDFSPVSDEDVINILQSTP